MLVARVSNCHTEAWALWVKRKKRKRKARMSCPTFVSSYFTLLSLDCSPSCWAGEWMSPRTDIFRNSLLESWGVSRQECITRTLGRWLTAWAACAGVRRKEEHIWWSSSSTRLNPSGILKPCPHISPRQRGEAAGGGGEGMSFGRWNTSCKGEVRVSPAKPAGTHLGLGS